MAEPTFNFGYNVIPKPGGKPAPGTRAKSTAAGFRAIPRGPAPFSGRLSTRGSMTRGFRAGGAGGS